MLDLLPFDRGSADREWSPPGVRPAPLASEGGAASDGDEGEGGAYDSAMGVALIDAARRGHSDVVRLLLASEAPVNCAAGPCGLSAMGEAAAAGFADIVSLLLGAGADPRLAGADGRTPAQLALERGHASLAAALLQAEAELTAQGAQPSQAAEEAARAAELELGAPVAPMARLVSPAAPVVPEQPPAEFGLAAKLLALEAGQGPQLEAEPLLYLEAEEPESAEPEAEYAAPVEPEAEEPEPAEPEAEYAASAEPEPLAAEASESSVPVVSAPSALPSEVAVEAAVAPGPAPVTPNSAALLPGVRSASAGQAAASSARKRKRGGEHGEHETGTTVAPAGAPSIADAPPPATRRRIWPGLTAAAAALGLGLGALGCLAALSAASGPSPIIVVPVVMGGGLPS
eukprot:scaffold25.g5083.t1